MATSIVVPRLGWTMEEGTFVQWLKQDGDEVKVGDQLFILEGEKAAQEVESLESGILRIPPDAPQPGQVVAVGSLLGYLASPGEPAPWESAPPAPPVGKANDVGWAESSRPTDSHDGPRRLGPPYETTPPKRMTPAISPRARRVAAELGIDWTTLTGSGRTGRIREADIRAAAPGAKPQAAGRVQPLGPVRRVIAERMLAGVHTTAPVTLTTRADATNLVQLRNQFKAVAETTVPSYTDFILKLTALALQKHPKLNASWTPEGIALNEDIHIGIAVDADAGLLAPVVREVSNLSLREIAKRTQSLIELARTRRLTAEQMQGGTFTITNLGMYGIDAFTPIINLPQCAILGVGRIHREPAVHEDRIVPRDLMTLSLTFDHRVVDGGPAARFLDTVRQYLEQPGPWLI